ncbi:MFS transporter [Streptomyces sp. NPDC054794]
MSSLLIRTSCSPDVCSSVSPPGVTSAVAPVLLAELAQAHWRGALITAYQLALAVGMLVAFAIGVTLHPEHNWRLMFAANAVPALALTATTLLIQQSPADLMARGDPGRARAVLTATRNPQEAQAEWEALKVGHSLPSKSTLRGLTDPALRRPVAIAVGAALMNALVGIPAVVYYPTLVFASAGVGGRSGAETASLAKTSISHSPSAMLMPQAPRRS